MSSILRRDTGEVCEAFVDLVAASSGLPTPTRAELV